MAPGADEDTTTITFPGLESLKGKRLGEFRVLREIGRGSMGVVFEAIQENLDRRVAIKVLPPSISLPEKSIRRFLREAESVAKLEHPNIVRIYAIGKKDSLYYFAMQYVEGRPLDGILADAHPLSFTRVADLVRQTAEAVDYAHRHGIIHRDVKPGNILVTKENKAIITDFGLARQERGATLTESGALVGTPIYMSPEQVQGKKDAIGKATDIYSLGVTLYELLTGKTPFTGENTQEILNSILEHDPRPPRKVRPGIPWELDVIAMKAMEKEPWRRFGTAGEMAADLRRYLDGEPILARPSGTLVRLFKKIRKHRLASAMASTALILLLAFAVYAFSTLSVQNKMKAYDQAVQEGQSFLGDMNQANVGKAVECFAKAVALFPERNEAHFLLGKAYLMNNDADRALDEFNLVIVRDPDDSASLLERAKIRFRRNMILEGLKDMMRVRALEPQNFSIAYECTVLLYNFYNESRELAPATRAVILEKAIGCAEEGLKHGNSADMHCRLAMLYFEKAKISPDGRDREAYIEKSLKEIDVATSLDKNHRMAYDLKEKIETSRHRADLIDLYKLARKEGYDEKWVISQGSELVEPVWDFLKNKFLPSLSGKDGENDPAKKKEPRF